MNIPNIRLLNQQLSNPLFREPKETNSFGDSNRGCSNCWLATRICVIIIYEYKRKCTK